MNRESCKGCIHHKNLTGDYRDKKKYCNYMLDTGEKRGCPPDKCTRKELHTGQENIFYKRLLWLEDYKNT